MDDRCDIHLLLANRNGEREANVTGLGFHREKNSEAEKPVSVIIKCNWIRRSRAEIHESTSGNPIENRSKRARSDADRNG